MSRVIFIFIITFFFTSCWKNHKRLQGKKIQKKQLCNYDFLLGCQSIKKSLLQKKKEKKNLNINF